MKFIVIFFVSLSSLLLAGPEIWLESGLITPEAIASVKTELGLTAEQASRINGLATELVTQAEPLEKQVREQQKALNKLLGQRETSEAAAAAALTALLEAEASLKQMRLRTLLALRDTLTAEQQEKALVLAPARQLKRSETETRVREKALRLKAAVDSLGVPPTAAMQERGAAVILLMRQGDMAAADQALDKLAKESGVDETDAVTEPDFSEFSPGDTELESLQQRYREVEQAAQSVVSIPLVRQLIRAKKALEEAKEADDAVAVGRILTWAEGVLKQP